MVITRLSSYPNRITTAAAKKIDDMETMTKYFYQGKEINHTSFIALCQRNGINGGRKVSHLQKLEEMAIHGNMKAQSILNALVVC